MPDHVWQDTIHISFGTLMRQGLIEDVISVGDYIFKLVTVCKCFWIPLCPALAKQGTSRSDKFLIK